MRALLGDECISRIKNGERERYLYTVARHIKIYKFRKGS